ncbi:MAG: DUF3105 domain-containing protein [bacterium]
MSKSLKEKRRQKLAHERRRRRLIIGTIAAVVVIGLGALIYARFLQSIPGLQEFPNQERGHAENVSIPDEGLPPVGGVHNPRWLNCGVYREPVDSAMAVHSLEHGAIWIAYHPDLPEEQIAELEAYADSYTLVAPYPGLITDVVASAWGAQVQYEGAPDDSLDQFIARYQGQGPEPGATCSGGVGSPVSAG